MCFSSDGQAAPAAALPPAAPQNIPAPSLDPSLIPNADGTMPTKSSTTTPTGSSTAAALTIPLGGVGATAQSPLNVPQ